MPTPLANRTRLACIVALSALALIAGASLSWVNTEPLPDLSAYGAPVNVSDRGESNFRPKETSTGWRIAIASGAGLASAASVAACCWLFVFVSSRAQKALSFVSSHRERVIAATALAVFALTLFAAPWEIQKRGRRGDILSSEITTAPLWKPPVSGTTRLRAELLSVQWAAIAIGAGGLWLLTRRKIPP